MRILQNDSSYVTLADIYEQYCEQAGIVREDPVFMMGEKTKSVIREFKKVNGRAVSSLSWCLGVGVKLCAGQP